MITHNMEIIGQAAIRVTDYTAHIAANSLKS